MSATANLYPLDPADMSPAEQLAANLLQKSLRPPGLRSEAAIWAEHRKWEPQFIVGDNRQARRGSCAVSVRLEEPRGD